jgi:plasmid stabilization system protein ParE
LKSYRFHGEAADEYEAAAVYYENQVPSLGREFSEALDAAIQLICRYPEAGQPAPSDCRRFVLTPFPYSVVYRIESEEIAIVCVSHQRRRPEYWRHRK